MKHWTQFIKGLTLLLVCALLPVAVSAAGPDEMLEYEVITVEPGSWIVTAKEVASGEVVKFRLPPSVFKGKTFDADLNRVKPGKKFSPRLPRNSRLNNVVVHSELPLKNAKKRGKLFNKQLIGPPAQALGWEITNVDSRQFVVTARNRKNRKIAKFKVDPGSFRGFRFKANLRGIRKGKGFTLATPNPGAMSNNCTLMELK